MVAGLRAQRAAALGGAVLVVCVGACNALLAIDDIEFGDESAGGTHAGGTAGTGGTAGSGATAGSGGTASGGTGGNGGTGGTGGTAGCGAGAPPQVVTISPSPRLTIPDDGYDGTIGSMACVTLAMVDQGCHDTQQVEVTMALEHTWIADLVIKVVSPASTITTLMSRPGYSEPADDGGDMSGGTNSDLEPPFPVTFQDGALTDAEQMGSTISGSEVVCQDDGLCDFFPNPGAGPGTNLADFNGEDPAGDWQVCVGDAHPMDGGEVHSVTLSVLAQ